MAPAHIWFYRESFGWLKTFGIWFGINLAFIGFFYLVARTWNFDILLYPREFWEYPAGIASSTLSLIVWCVLVRNSILKGDITNSLEDPDSVRT